jgi:hypothetical protein
MLDIFAGVSTPRSRFDLFHTACGQLLSVQVQGLVTGQRYDLVRRKVGLGGHPTEGLA